MKVCQAIDHPNVFGDWICLDMIKTDYYHMNQSYGGWTSGYSATSILMQLQSYVLPFEIRGAKVRTPKKTKHRFLFSENVPQKSGYSQINTLM